MNSGTEAALAQCANRFVHVSALFNPPWPHPFPPIINSYYKHSHSLLGLKHTNTHAYT